MGDYPDTPPARERLRNQFKDFNEEILQKVIKPKIIETFHKFSDTINSRSDMLAIFNEEHHCSISMGTFSEWLDQLGVKFERTVKVIGLESPARGGLAARPAPAPSEDQGVDEEVRFDNEVPSDFQRPRGYGDMFGEINKGI